MQEYICDKADPWCVPKGCKHAVKHQALPAREGWNAEIYCFEMTNICPVFQDKGIVKCKEVQPCPPKFQTFR